MTESGGSEGSLKREMGFPALTIYGVGGMLGGGIYALVGKVAGEAGTLSWVSFVAAMSVAAPTAFTYAALGSRYPRSGGESVFAQEALGSERLAFLTGWTVVFSGLVSMATLAHGFSGYLRALWPPLPEPAILLGFVVLLALINGWGIRLTSRANVAATAIEFSGLLLVIVAGLLVVAGDGGSAEASAVARAAVDTGSTSGSASASPTPGPPWMGIVTGATLAFYAFIGFEDMVNVAEEVERPRRNLPRAITLALVSVGLTYAAVSFLATAAVPPGDLDASGAPLHLVVRSGIPSFPGSVFTVVALFAVGNSALLNFVMASRLVYGMSDQTLLPSWLGTVHEHRRTPHRAILVVGSLALAMALSGTLEMLAATTSLLILAVFFLMNLSYLRIRLREDGDAEVFSVPAVVPVTGMILSVALAAFVSQPSLVAGGGVILVGVAFMVVLEVLR